METERYTELTTDGIRTRGLFGTRHAAWADIRDLGVLDYRGRGVYSVRVALRSGKGFRLGAPVHSQVMADPAFPRKVERIVTACRQARPGPASGAGAP